MNLGTFSKAVTGAISCNFSENGGQNCSSLCPLKKSRACYGIRVESMRDNIKQSGISKRLAGPVACALSYAGQIKGIRHAIPWIRFSVFGSVPHSLDEEGKQAFDILLKSAAEKGPVHFPVESPRKRKLYGNIGKKYGVVVRESCHTVGRAINRKKEGIPASVVMAKREGETRLELLARSKAWCKDNGGMVCPAIASTFEKRKNRVKCGDCKACASEHCSLVVYPQH